MREAVAERQPAIDPEAALVAAARVDRHAFGALYHRHVTAIYRFCYRRLGTKEAAEDATAQVFLKALSGLGGFRGGSFQGWLFAIAAHVVVDAGRANRPHAPLAAAVAVVADGPDPEAAAVGAESVAALRRVLADLSPEQRRVVELRLAGLSGVEIAAVLGRSHGTVRNLQHRTLVRLRELLGVTVSAGEAPDG